MQWGRGSRPALHGRGAPARGLSHGRYPRPSDRAAHPRDVRQAGAARPAPPRTCAPCHAPEQRSAAPDVLPARPSAARSGPRRSVPVLVRPPPPLSTQPVCEQSASVAASPRDVGPSGQGLAPCSLARQRCAERAACGALSCTRFVGTAPTTALHTVRKSGAAPPTPSPARSSEARAGAECGAGAGSSAEAEHFVELAGRPFLEVPPAPP